MREAEIARKDRVAHHVRENAERAADHHRRHDREAVEPIGQIDRVAGPDDDEKRQRDESPDAQRIRHRLEEGDDQVGACG